MIVSFRDNEISVSESTMECQFRESYTLTISNCQPHNVEGSEFRIRLGSSDNILEEFLHEIMTAVGIVDGSLEQTITDEKIIATIHDGSTEFRRAIGGRSTKIPRLKLLEEHYPILERHPNLTVSVVFERFHIVNMKYIVAKFNLLSVTMVSSGGGGGGEPRIGPTLDDFLVDDAPVNLGTQETNLSSIYDGVPTVSLELELD